MVLPLQDGWCLSMDSKEEKYICDNCEKAHFQSNLNLGITFAQTQDYYLEYTGNSCRSTRKRPETQWKSEQQIDQEITEGKSEWLASV